MKQIPDEDVKLINDSFKNRPGQSLVKDSNGRLVRAEQGIINPRGYVINGFSGRRLKINKFLVKVDGHQVVVASKGQAYDDIPIEYQKMSIFSESDFE